MVIDRTKFKFPDRYTQKHPYLPVRVSKLGEVFSMPSEGNHWQGRVLKTFISNNGYERVGIYINGKQKYFCVHRLVWETYNQQRIPDGYQINHIDEDKRNNRPENLNLMTCKENVNWGTGKTRRAKAMTNGKNSKPVIQLDLQGNVIKEWPSIMEVQRQTGWVNSFIGKACRGKYKQAYGFRWQYKD